MKFPRRLFHALIVWSLPVLASHARLSMDVSAGFDGKQMPQTWVPVLVELFNDGPPVQGFLEASPPTPSSNTVYSKPVVLPTNSRKRVWLYPYAGNYTSQFNVRLVALNGRTIAETTAALETLAPTTALYVSATPSEVNLLPLRPPTTVQTPIVSARIRPVALPDDAAGLGGVRAMLLTDTPESEWTSGQRKAIRNWVALGGHLIVSVKNADDFIHSKFWDELLPMRITGSGLAPDLAGLDRIAGSATSLPAATPANAGPQDAPPIVSRTQTPVAVGEILRGTARATTGTMPLVLEAPFGRGTVTLLTFSIEREPFRSWTAKERFWQRLLELPVEPPRPTLAGQKGKAPQPPPVYWGAATLDDMMRGMLESRLERQISLWWLLGLIGCYLVVIGPFDYWLVRHKLKRPVLTWVTFPGYVIGFSALIYGIGYTLKSGDSELVQVSFVDVIPEAGLSRGTTVTGFYSTSNRHYEFDGTQPESHFRLSSSGFDNPSSSPLRDTTRVIETDHGFVTSVPVPIWSSRTFVTEWTAPDAGLSVVRKKTDHGETLEMANRLPTPLTDVRLVTRGRVCQAPDINPQETVLAPVAVEGKDTLENWLARITSPIWSQFQYWGFPFQHIDPKKLPPWNAVLPALSFGETLRQIQPNMHGSVGRDIDLTPWAINDTIIVLAYAESYPEQGFEPAFKPDQTRHHALLRCVLRPSSTLSPEP